MILQIILTGLVAAALAMLVRQYRPELSLGIAAAFGIGVFLLAAVQLGGVFQSIQKLLQTASIRQEYWSLLIKAVGIAYIAEFASQICRDAGEGAIAQKIDLGAKVTLLSMAVPVLLSAVELVLSVLEQP